MKTAIVILNWNGQKLLEQFLPSVICFSEQDAVVYVADNASTDGSISFVKSNFPTVKIIQNFENGGYAKGYNDALKNIDADIFCLINSDIEVTENWLSPILETFKKQSKTAVIQPKILDFKDNSKFEYAGAGGGFLDFFGYPYCCGRVFNHLEKDEGQFNENYSIFWASGACLFIRSEVFYQVNGFDESYFAHQEEIDLCWRIQNLGFDIHYVGKSTVYHVGGATLTESNPRKTFLNFRNNLLTLVKNLPKNRIFLVVFTRLILDGIAGIKYLVELKPKHTWAIVRAHFSFYRNLQKSLKHRKKVAKKQDYFLHKNIVWQHFVLGRKKFEDLK